MITGVIAPLAAEARTARPLRRLGWRVVHSGVGAPRARAAALALLDDGVERLLVWGTAGGLVPEMRPGTLVLPREVCDESGARYAMDEAWREAIRTRVPVPDRAPVLVSTRTPVVSARDKRALAQNSGAQAVDMETAAVASIAAERGVPCVVVRAIADPLELALPGVVLAARGDRLLALEIPLRLVLHPRDFPALRTLARSFGAARRSLSGTARYLASTPEPWPVRGSLPPSGIRPQ